MLTTSMRKMKPCLRGRPISLGPCGNLQSELWGEAMDRKRVVYTLKMKHDILIWEFDPGG